MKRDLFIILLVILLVLILVYFYNKREDEIIYQYDNSFKNDCNRDIY